MKKIVGYSLIAMVGLLSACEKQLDQDPISAQATASFYTSTIEFTQGVNAVYNGLKTYPDRLLNLSETRSDNYMPYRMVGCAIGKVLTAFIKPLQATYM